MELSQEAKEVSVGKHLSQMSKTKLGERKSLAEMWLLVKSRNPRLPAVEFWSVCRA